MYHFCDNTTALSAAIHGYANHPDLADASNALHCAACGLRLDVWLEWMASKGKANLADVPSRPTKDQGVLVRLGVRQVRLDFPTMEEWRNPALLLRRVYPEPEYVGAKRRRGKAQCHAAVQRRKVEK